MAQSPDPSLSCQQVRHFDQVAIERLGIPGMVLMENAARGCVDLILKHSPCERVIIVCGKGNNGGDGFAMARLLLVHQKRVKVLLVGDPDSLKGDARLNFQTLQRIAPNVIERYTPFSESRFREQISEIDGDSPDWLVDAILGTGTTGELREPFRSIIDIFNESSAGRFAVDLPSGLQADEGTSLGAIVKADLTGTFVARKLGFKSKLALEHLGQVHVLDIGVPFSAVDLSQSEP